MKCNIRGGVKNMCIFGGGSSYTAPATSTATTVRKAPVYRSISNQEQQSAVARQLSRKKNINLNDFYSTILSTKLSDKSSTLG